jgi:hypothetical protein
MQLYSQLDTAAENLSNNAFITAETMNFESISSTLLYC